jgi:hypothetical protein
MYSYKAPPPENDKPILYALDATSLNRSGRLILDEVCSSPEWHQPEVYKCPKPMR